MVGYGQGRGRGGPNVTGVEQMGFGVGENVTPPVLQPPPTYPPLEMRPIPLRTGPEEDYLVELRTDFIESLRDSPAYVLPQVVRSDIERYSDRYQTAAPKVKSGLVTLHHSYLPAELRPVMSSDRKSKKAGAVKKEVDINTRLEELEKKEGQTSEDEEEKEGNEKEVEDKEVDERDEEELEDVEDVDEEMDNGTDYVNNYFDNGDSYLDEEDDNLDDGPVY